MTALRRRLMAEIERVRSLCERSGGRLRLRGATGLAPDVIELEVTVRTAASSHYPQRAQHGVEMTIFLASRYPFERPRISVRPLVFHPNVYSNGDICMGAHWLPTETLDVSIRRAVQILTFDPLVTNPDSPANPAAASWYGREIRSHPEYFPTDRVDFAYAEEAVSRTLRWVDVPRAKPSGVFSCLSCRATLTTAVGAGKRVRCPRCTSLMEVPG